MEAIQQHFQENLKYYIVIAVVVLPPLLYFRRYSLPFIAYVIEYCVYCVIMHVGMHVITYAGAWFKDQTTMKRARGLADQDYNPGWTTPWFEFWKRELYEPRWIFYVEIAFVVLIAILMWRYRPLRTQRKKPKPYGNKKNTVGSAGAKPGNYSSKGKGGSYR